MISKSVRKLAQCRLDYHYASNAQNALIGRKVVAPKITINAEKIKEMILIDIEDNAGGITVSPIEKFSSPTSLPVKTKTGKSWGFTSQKIFKIINISHYHVFEHVKRRLIIRYNCEYDFT